MDAVVNNDIDTVVELVFDDDIFLDCYADNVALKEAHPDLLAAELDLLTDDPSMVDMQVEGDKGTAKFSIDESKTEAYRNECAGIGDFYVIPLVTIECTFQGLSATLAIENTSECNAKTDACANVDTMEYQRSTFTKLSEAVGFDCDMSSDISFDTSKASAFFRWSVTSAIFAGLVVAALL